MTVELPLAEELAERWGGNIDLDLARELSGQIVLQRTRLDKMHRGELEMQKSNTRYFDKRIGPEQERLESLIKTLHSMMKSPLEAAKERTAADAEAGSRDLKLSDDAGKLLTQLILDGEISLGVETA